MRKRFISNLMEFNRVKHHDFSSSFTRGRQPGREQAQAMHRRSSPPPAVSTDRSGFFNITVISIKHSSAVWVIQITFLLMNSYCIFWARQQCSFTVFFTSLDKQSILAHYDTLIHQHIAVSLYYAV